MKTKFYESYLKKVGYSLARNQIIEEFNKNFQPISHTPAQSKTAEEHVRCTRTPKTLCIEAYNGCVRFSEARLIFVDYKKAFDLFGHNLPMYQLKRYIESILLFFTGLTIFLSDHKRGVMLENDTFSCWYNV